ncbi:Hypothetical predicted protein [Pelobates cultripes]|uniref:Uncharacterized protein n=1 Tax=Pelobates cultripes TaxID=61616 RepID=A0AAD1WFM4_PELCU|nr:Hypothetical predicted protein [Pelobates cultripes]
MALMAGTRGSRPESPSTSECATENYDLSALITKLPFKANIGAMFQRLEDSFGEKVQAVSADVQHLDDRVQALEDDGEAADQQWTECHTT